MEITAGAETMEQAQILSQHQPIQAISTPDGPCYFWAVPLEVREMIYELCYDEPQDLKVTTREFWTACEKSRERRKRRSFVPGVFSPTFLGHLLVSKQYCEEAIPVWARSKVFRLEYNSDIDPVLETGSAVERHLLRHIRSIAMVGGSIFIPRSFDFMPNLKHLTVPRMDEYSFSSHAEKLVWSDDFTDIELAQFPDIRTLLKLRGLRSLTLKWTKPYTIVEPEEMERWKRTQLQVQKLVNDVVLKPREKSEATPPSWAFEDALEEARAKKAKQATDARNRFSATSADQARSVATPVKDDELPETESELLRLVLARPQATLAWLKDARKAKVKVAEMAKAEPGKSPHDAIVLD